MLLQEYIGNVLQEPVPFREFAAKLQENGIEVKLNQASTGTISGISFSLNGISFKGSKLGKGYTWNALKQKGLYYENGYAAEHESIRHEYSQGKRTADTSAGTAAERTGTFGNAVGTSEPTGESGAAKQSRIAENFARLEKEFYRDRQRPEKLSNAIQVFHVRTASEYARTVQAPFDAVRKTAEEAEKVLHTIREQSQKISTSWSDSILITSLVTTLATSTALFVLHSVIPQLLNR